MAPAKQEVSAAHHFFGGWLGGSVACILLSPLEVLKTRLQVQARLPAHTVAANIFRQEGIAGFYRGLVPHLIGVGPARAFYFGTYNLAKKELSQHGLHGASLHLIAAGIGTVISATLMSPVWVVKTRLQLQQAPVKIGIPPVLETLKHKAEDVLHFQHDGGGSGAGLRVSPVPHAAANLSATSAVRAGPLAAVSSSASAATRSASTVASNLHDLPYKSMADAFSRMYREEGMRSFYRGLSASYLGVIETAIQFALYGNMKERVIQHRIQKMKAEHPNRRLPSDQHQLNRMAYSDTAAFCTSAASKLVASFLTYPHEVLRTRMREQRSANPRYTGVFQTARLIIREEGFGSLYGGLGVHMLRTVPNAAILLMVVEKVVGGDV